MKLERSVKLFFVALLLIAAAFFLFSQTSYATDDDCRRGHSQCGHGDNDGTTNMGGAGGAGGLGGSGGGGGDGGSVGPVTDNPVTNVEANPTADSASDSSAAAELVITGEVGAGGGATVTTKSESNSLYLGAARDSADCFTKVQLGADGFGLGWSRSDPYCKKIRLIARKTQEGNFDAAVRLECTLPEWKEVYGHKRVRNKSGKFTAGFSTCIDELMPDVAAGGDENFNVPQPAEVAASLRSVGDEHEEDISMVLLEQQQIRDELDTLRMEQRTLQSRPPPPPQEPFLTEEKRKAVWDALYGVDDE